MGGSFARMCMPHCPTFYNDDYMLILLFVVVGIGIAMAFAR